MNWKIDLGYDLDICENKPINLKKREKMFTKIWKLVINRKIIQNKKRRQTK